MVGSMARSKKYDKIDLVEVCRESENIRRVRFTGPPVDIAALDDKLSKYGRHIRMEATGEKGPWGSVQKALLDVPIYAVEGLLKHDEAFRDKFADAFKSKLQGQGSKKTPPSEDPYATPPSALEAIRDGLKIKAVCYLGGHYSKPDSIAFYAPHREIKRIKGTVYPYIDDFRERPAQRRFGISMGEAIFVTDIEGVQKTLEQNPEFAKKYGEKIEAAIAAYSPDKSLKVSLPISEPTLDESGISMMVSLVDYPNQIAGKKNVRLDVTDVKTHEKLLTFLGDMSDGLQFIIHPAAKGGVYKITSLHAVTPEANAALNALLPEGMKQPAGNFSGDRLRVICESLVKCEPFTAVYNRELGASRLHGPASRS